MYKSPIEVIAEAMQTSFTEAVEADVINVVRNLGIKVNKDELIKALEYDRQQYKKGYKDGAKDFAEKVINKIKTVPTKFDCALSVYRGLEIIDIIKEMVEEATNEDSN